MIERVRKLFRVRPVAVSESRIIRRDHVITITKPREQWLEHPRRRGKSVQQQKRRRILRPSLPIKNGKPINLHLAISSRAISSIFHMTFLSLALRQRRKCREHHTN